MSCTIFVFYRLIFVIPFFLTLLLRHSKLFDENFLGAR